jgi:DNA-binding transcriptional ArsR family regulator
VATARVRVKAQSSFLARLAVVYADPIRLKIVSELFMREMSPSQFYDGFGGGSLSRVDRHFKRLAEHGWLRLVRKASGGRRRGATEHFYRAPELAIFDSETWALLPQTLRTEFSWRIFEQFAERVKEALEGGTFDARPDRHFTWTPLALDEMGRERVIAAVDALFTALSEEQADARLRIAKSGEKPIEATVGLAAFDSPSPRRNRSGLLLPAVEVVESADALPFAVRVAKVFADPLNLKIVTELNLREMSPTQFVDECGGAPLAGVDRRFKLLTEIGWLTKVGEKSGGRRRGATENFYRATGPAIFDSRSWSKVEDSVRVTFSWRIFEQLAEQAREAMDAGTFDSRVDRHHSWTPLVLDQLGWDQVIAAVDALFHLLFEEQAAAKARLARSGEEPVIATVYLAAFESPPLGRKPHVGPTAPGRPCVGQYGIDR